LQEVVPVMDGDTEQSLGARVLEMEHQMYPRAVRQFVEGRLVVQDGRVYADSIAQHHVDDSVQ
jgi:phosphoribosylglycinamide formyltransferase 1